MTTDYNVIVDLDTTGEPADELLDGLRPYHPALSLGPRGTVEAILTVSAESLAQAVVTGLAAAAGATGREPAAVQAMTTADFDVTF